MTKRRTLSSAAYQYLCRKIARGFDIRLYPRVGCIAAYKAGYRAALRRRK